MDQSANAGSSTHSRPLLARRLWLAAVVLLLGLAGAIFWATRGSVRPQQVAERMLSEIPVGSTHDQLRSWLAQEGYTLEGGTFWYQDPAEAAKPFNAFPFTGKTLAQLAGVSADEVSSVVFVPLPGRADLDRQLRPHRMDVYILLDQEDRVAGSYTHTYPQKELWKQLLP